MFLTSMITGSKIRTMWMTPFYLFFGVLLIDIYKKDILLNKLKKFSCDIFGAYDEDDFTRFKYFEYVTNNRSYIIHIYKLYAKYSQVLSHKFIRNSHHLTDNLILMNFIMHLSFN